MRCSKPWRKSAGSWDHSRPPTSGLVPVVLPPRDSTSAMPRAVWTGSLHMPEGRGSPRNSGVSSMRRRSRDLHRNRLPRSCQPSSGRLTEPSRSSGPRQNPPFSKRGESVGFSCLRRCWGCCSMPPSTRNGMWGRSSRPRESCRGSGLAHLSGKKRTRPRRSSGSEALATSSSWSMQSPIVRLFWWA